MKLKFKLTKPACEIFIEKWNYNFQVGKFDKVLLNLSILFLLLFLNSISIYAQERVKTISLFDGKTLRGWKTVDPAHQKLWYVVDSVIVSGNSKDKIPENTYLYTEKEY